jgi:hypothetical protein
MKFHKLALVVPLFAAVGAAHANVAVSKVGPVTTYSENFNGGSSFSSGWFDARRSADDYTWLRGSSKSSSFTIDSASALASLTLEFWYSVPADGQGLVTLASSSGLGLHDAPGGLLAFRLADTGSGNRFSSFFSTTVKNLAAGEYTVSFATTAGRLRSLKVDDVVITTSVPEPGSYALMLAGLAVVGGLAYRRRPL